ncbi:helix-turn-helix transcriptional regulator [Pseudomonas sp. GOM7]|uniref:helix-turn-helix transcriptional regulator n=1 Tax=Pseudomonas sp. GOM7 TaxID=2998079 RepID=UPI00227BD787|nr:helix-turn-helix transcriptional regulator [Pseudomonas sp. GOM7]WAJ35459.1 helix-turn-helix transcriptional regulator [Pseudomonas sp. GOM7]
MNSKLQETGKRSAYFLALGRLISSVGSHDFVSHMHELINDSVPIDLTQISEWTIDENERKVINTWLIGTAPAVSETCPQDHDWLLGRLLESEEAPLIHNKYPNAMIKEPTPCLDAWCCNVASRKSNRYWLISLHRHTPQKDFSIHELSFLKNFSETLLPLLERHAQATRELCDLPQMTPDTSGGRELQRNFNEKLKLTDTQLSMREREICLGLLAGATVPEMAEKLHVKNSSIETYLKRAAAKLGVKGRHGLVKWMIGMSQGG